MLAQLPYLRRYARASTGSQQAGDALVKGALEAFVADSEGVSCAAEGTRLALFRCFHNVRNRLGVPAATRTMAGVSDGDLVQRRVEERVGALPHGDREPLLLIHTEGFSRTEAAEILGLTEAEVTERLEHAWSELKQEARIRVLIIEDEPVIALDIAGIVADMGHHVAGVATRSDEAVALARSEKPDLVLADIQLEDGNTGIAAVAAILRDAFVPVVFVTAYPERLLTGERIEPAFIVAKPFEPEVLQIAVSQALFCAASPS
ncbi:MAG: response regulator [Alphaproteobacteria bacterium]|nr:response regulator [Alphaproteobacteria bacterium]